MTIRRLEVTQSKLRKIVGALSAFALIVPLGVWTTSQRVQADDNGNDDESRIQQGFAIAPVPLNLAGKNGM